MVLELGSMGSKRRRLELVEITIGIEIFRETITELKLSVEDNTLKAERRMEKKTPVISETLTRVASALRLGEQAYSNMWILHSN